MRHQDLEATVGCHRSRGIPADEQAVPRVTRSHPSVVAEHLTGHTELEWGESVVDDDRNIVGDVASVRARLLWRGTARVPGL